MTTRSVALATLLFTLSVAAERPEPKLTLESKFLGERRRVLVSMPPSYAKGDERYPVLVLTDAGLHLEHTIASADALAGVLRMPELIIVGVPSSDRRHDLTPTDGGRRFGSFIAAELIPEVDRRYRTHPYRILAGHSLGGLFALDLLFTRPAAFNGWIAISPGAGKPDDSILELARAAKHFEKNETLILMVAEEEPFIVSGVRKLEEVLVARKIGNLELVRRDLPDDDHLTSPISGFYGGLRLLFKPWFFRIADNDDPKTLYARAQEHYRRVSERYGFHVPIPAFRLERIRQLEKATRP